MGKALFLGIFITARCLRLLIISVSIFIRWISSNLASFRQSHSICRLVLCNLRNSTMIHNHLILYKHQLHNQEPISLNLMLKRVDQFLRLLVHMPMIKLNRLQSKFIWLFLNCSKLMISFRILNIFQRGSSNCQLVGYDFVQEAFIDF